MYLFFRCKVTTATEKFVLIAVKYSNCRFSQFARTETSFSPETHNRATIIHADVNRACPVVITLSRRSRVSKLFTHDAL